MSSSSSKTLHNTILKLSKTFGEPPHTTSLYDTLQVLPNATSIEISKQYRKLSRRYHPDKVKDGEQKLEEVRKAFDVLKNDSTRLLYHKFGFEGNGNSAQQACLILTGNSGVLQNSNSANDEVQKQLMRLMGYDIHRNPTGNPDHQRIYFIAADLVERIRPLVEGALSEDDFVYDVAAQCDLLKRLPLGSQIIRCIGRAYRHSGQRIMKRYQKAQQMQHQQSIIPVSSVVSGGLDLTDSIHQQFRDAKNIFTAAIASGKLVLSEQTIKRKMKSTKPSSTPSIEYSLNDDDLDFIGSDGEGYVSAPTETELEKLELEKMQSAIREALQVEALWKINKIDLDRVVQEACSLIMSGKYFFFPSHQQSYSRRGKLDDGWVALHNGVTIDYDVGRARAAAALILIGDTFVRCSKEKTSWTR